MRIPGIKNLSGEIKLLDEGHTLGLTRIDNLFYAYRGFEDFDKIDLFVGKSLLNLKFQKTVLKENKRWAVPFIANNRFYIFSTSSIGTLDDICRYQVIWLYESIDGFDFKTVDKITEGSAPWIYFHDDWFYLYYHKKLDTRHEIYFRKSRDIYALKHAEEKTILTMEIGDMNHEISAPSLVKIGCNYNMLFEYKNKYIPWQTSLYEFKGPEKNLMYLSRFLDNNRACAFHYVFNKQYIVTYSVLGEKGWYLAMKEGDTE